MHSLPTTVVLLVAVSLACGDSTAPSVPQYPHTAAAIRIVSGDNQTAVVGTKFPQPIVLEVLDSAGQPAWGRRVSAGGGVDSATTDRSGRAVITATAGTVAGTGTIDLEPEDQGYSAATRVSVHVTTLPRPFERIDTLLHDHYMLWMLTTKKLVRDDLFAPVDTFGNVVPWPATTWVLPAGWTVRGDTAIPPAGVTGVFRIGIQAGTKSAARTLPILDDLRQYRWKVTWACGGGVPSASGSSDSLLFVGTVRSMAYPGDPGFYQGPKGDLPNVQPFVDGQLTTVNADGTSTTSTVSNMSVIGMWQSRPDTLDFPYDANMGTPAGKIAVRQSGALPSYVGGSWCYDLGFTRQWPVKLTAY